MADRAWPDLNLNERFSVARCGRSVAILPIPYRGLSPGLSRGRFGGGATAWFRGPSSAVTGGNGRNDGVTGQNENNCLDAGQNII
jgi:hypothetical protein